MFHQLLHGVFYRCAHTFPAIALFAFATSASAQQIFYQDFETGGPDWTTTAGIWQVGQPTAGPAGARAGNLCAGTVLNGNYTGYDDSRLVYPTLSGTLITLPTVQADEELRLRYWAWVSYSSYDYGYVQVDWWDAEAGNWHGWETVPHSKALDSVYALWHQRDVDLTPYSGKSIRLAFYHTANRNVYGHASESTGWYIDDIEIERITPRFTGEFDGRQGDWVVEDGLWEFGEPGVGPAESHSRPHCVGTRLSANYQGYRDSRLISPSFVVAPVSGPEQRVLSYYQWWSYSSYDSGRVQVQSFDGVSGTWSPWSDLPGSSVSGVSSLWTKRELALTPWAGERVRVAFFHTADRNVYGHASESTGWYIDEIHVTGTHEPIATFCTGELSTGLCPCGNGSLGGTNEGCINSTGLGARLYATGSTSSSDDELTLHVLQARGDTFGVFFQGVVPSSTPFRDGVLCAGNPINRIGTVLLDSSGVADSSIYSLVAAGNVTPGQVSYYQFWFRDAGPGSACGNGSNLTNGLRVDWQ